MSLGSTYAFSAEPSQVGSDRFNGHMRIHTLDGGAVNLRAEPWLDGRVIRPLQTGDRSVPQLRRILV